MRHENWQNKFWDALRENGEQQFSYGSIDCVLFAANMADAISVDGRYAERAKSMFKWASTREALILTRERSLVDMVEDVLGPIQRWQELQHGDIVAVVRDNETGSGPEQMLGVHDGVQVMAKGAHALVPVWWSEALGGWRVT